MAGLVGYASSDDGSDIEEQNLPQEQPVVSQPTQDDSKAEPLNHVAAATGPLQPSSTTPTLKVEQTSSRPEPQIGPSLGPSLPSADDQTSLPEAPPSPSSHRALIQDLTLPSIPDFDIPPSPPGSPPVNTHKKFEQFITLKKRGTHFNAKLESSTATRNPSLMDKLLGFVDVTGGAQYQTTLSRDLWDPSVFPDSAYRTRLRRAQDRIAKERDSERTSGGRNSVEFVPSVGLTRGNKRRLDNDID